MRKLDISAFMQSKHRALAAAFCGTLVLLLVSCGGYKADEQLATKPSIYPDYTDVTVPVNIAQLNFGVEGEYSKVCAVYAWPDGSTTVISGKKYIEFPLRKWHRKLDQSKGREVKVTVAVRSKGRWVEYAPFAIAVSSTPIDYGIAYRRIAPGYEVYSKMGIYQRNLSNFDETPIVENTLLPGHCVNCHSFKQTDPALMTFHVRGKHGGTALVKDGRTEVLNTKTDQTISNFVYPYWHPSGRYIAYSNNATKQVFHEFKDKRIEVFDTASDVIVYDIKNNAALLCPTLMDTTIFETFPAFAADGKRLFFCAAQRKEFPAQMREVRYNLCSISFDPSTGTFGKQVDTLFNARAIGKSVSFPRPSYDGRHLLFTLSNYGNFSIWHPEADLYMLDLKSGEVRLMSEVNSNNTESYHSWSSDSRWIVFGSRRGDGLYTRPYIAFVDANGKGTKPFLVPQKSPEYYEQSIYSFNIPEFISGKVKRMGSDFEPMTLAPKNVTAASR